MPKITTAVDVRFLVELSMQEAIELRDELGSNTGNTNYALFDKLDDAVKAAAKITKGVE